MAALALIALFLAACNSAAEETPMPMPEPAFESVVSVTGEVLPAKWATLSIQTAGTVEAVLVEEGDAVAAGDLLVQLDTIDAELSLSEAQAQLSGAEAQVSQLEAHPRSQDVAAAQQQVSAAEAAIAPAVAERDRLASGVAQSDVARADAEVVAASAELRVAEIDYEETRDRFEDDDLDEWELQEAGLRLRAAEQTLEAARLSLANARGSAGARMEEAEATVRLAEAQRDVAQAQLDLVLAGVLDEEIALTRTDVAQAQVAIEEAELRLVRHEHYAPFAGTVGMVAIREGEQVQQGDLMLTLGDLSTLRVETTDLDEIDVARVAVGQVADVTFDALPDRVFKGQVVRIDPMAVSEGGGVNYTTIIELDELSPEIRWGMTAFVDIEVGQ
jgi:multidrug resistance efflux pump